MELKKSNRYTAERRVPIDQPPIPHTHTQTPISLKYLPPIYLSNFPVSNDCGIQYAW